MATCTQYFAAIDEDGNKVDFVVDVRIMRWNGEEYIADGMVSIPANGIGSRSLTKDTSYKASSTTRPDGWLLPTDVPFIACDYDVTIRYIIDCPTPFIEAIDFSPASPKTGEEVSFWKTGDGGGTGQYITSRDWNFGDGSAHVTTSGAKHTYDTAGDYTVVYTVTNDCGKSISTSKPITVAAAQAKHGIEIQISPSMNGKQLIAHGALGTALGLWWTGPSVVDGILWHKGRCTWDNIDSSKTYAIQVGDACECGIARTEPNLCAGTFGNNSSVVILIRNPGFDFRIYNSNDIYPLDNSNFYVLYLDKTSGDIIDKLFMETVCGWLGVPAGTECDVFWAEFYDPIFVANYMSIMATGKDMFGVSRTLTWIDHVAFIAAIIGSLPVLNIIPIGAVVTRIGDAVKVITKATLSLGVADAIKAAEALVDVCKNAPETIGRMSAEEIAELRQALVKVYGDTIGNGHVDDALKLASGFVEKYGHVLEWYARGMERTIDPHHIVGIIEEGVTNPTNVISAFDTVPAELKAILLRNLKTGGVSGEYTISYPLANLLNAIHTAKQLPHVTPDALNNMTQEICKVQKKTLSEVDPNVASNIAQESFELPFRRGKVIDDTCGTKL